MISCESNNTSAWKRKKKETEKQRRRGSYNPYTRGCGGGSSVLWTRVWIRYRPTTSSPFDDCSLALCQYYWTNKKTLVYIYVPCYRTFDPLRFDERSFFFFKFQFLLIDRGQINYYLKVFLDITMIIKSSSNQEDIRQYFLLRFFSLSSFISLFVCVFV